MLYIKFFSKIFNNYRLHFKPIILLNFILIINLFPTSLVGLTIDDLTVISFNYKFTNAVRKSNDKLDTKINSKTEEVIPNSEYSRTKIQLIKEELVISDGGTKSVLISPDGKKVYAMNLEGMSICEYDRASRKILRKLIFVPTPGEGYDYKKKVKIKSYQEKPVEACFTHNGKYLWVSLHNANGVVVWDVLSDSMGTYFENKTFKKASLIHYDSNGKPITKQDIKLLFIKTGKTPKVITSSPNGKYLFVSNWHSNNVSVIDVSSDNPYDWNKIRDLNIGVVPRGLAVSEDSKYLYIAQMGSNFISVVDVDSLITLDKIIVGRGPRHILYKNGSLFISINNENKLIRVNLNSNNPMKVTTTKQSPRTIALSKDKNFVFVVCYHANILQIFDSEQIQLLNEYESANNPVGVDIYQNDGIIEAWVCNYNSGNIKIFTFKTFQRE